MQGFMATLAHCSQVIRLIVTSIAIYVVNNQVILSATEPAKIVVPLFDDESENLSLSLYYI